MSENELQWAPDACTLPSVERPLRLAEFDELFAAAVLGQERVGATRLRWVLDAESEAAARDLTARESSCCSFFGFAFSHDGQGGLVLDIEVPPAQVDVLDALAVRAAARIRT